MMLYNIQDHCWYFVYMQNLPRNTRSRYFFAHYWSSRTRQGIYKLGKGTIRECLLNLIWTGKISPCWSLAYYEHNSKEASRLCPQKVQLEFHSLGLSWPGFWLDQKSWKQSICLLSLAKQILFSYFEFRKESWFHLGETSLKGRKLTMMRLLLSPPIKQ